MSASKVCKVRDERLRTFDTPKHFNERYILVCANIFHSLSFILVEEADPHVSDSVACAAKY